MGIKLVCEVLDSPADLTTTQRLVLVSLAERANDTSREVWTRSDESIRAMLLRRTGLTEAGLARALQGIRDNWGEVRVPIGTSASGSPVFAYRGRQTTRFRVPLASLPASESPDDSPTIRDEKPGLSSDIAQTTVQAREPESPDDSPPLSLMLPTGLPQARPVADAELAAEIAALGVDRVIAARVCELAAADASTEYSWQGRLRKAPSYLRKLVRQAQDEDSAAAAAAEADSRRCPHGKVNGARIVAADGTTLCEHCDRDNAVTVQSRRSHRTTRHEAAS